MSVTSDPDIQGGRPCISGTRIPVTAIWHFHEAGYSASAIIKEYPTLAPEQIEAAITYMMEALRYR